MYNYIVSTLTIKNQVKNKIIEIIQTLKDGLEGKELSAVSNNNKKDNIYGREKRGY